MLYLVHTGASIGWRLGMSVRNLRQVEIDGVVVRRARPVLVDAAWYEAHADAVAAAVAAGALELMDQDMVRVDPKTLARVGVVHAPPLPPQPKPDTIANDPPFNPAPELVSASALIREPGIIDTENDPSDLAAEIAAPALFEELEKEPAPAPAPKPEPKPAPEPKPQQKKRR